jgi:condensin complex subunit 2
LDFAVDPLFKKTSADFDEGGARGLLLNHLSIDRHCKIIFDASDSTIERDETNPQEDPMEIETDEKIQDEEMDVDQTAEQVNTSKESQADDAEEEGDKANERDEINDAEDKPVEDTEDKLVEDAEDKLVEDTEEGQAEEAKGEKGVEMFDKSNMIEISRLKCKFISPPPFFLYCL